MTRRKRSQKSSAAGLVALELIALLGFSAALMTSAELRQAPTASAQPSMAQPTQRTIAEPVSGWDQHRPRFSEVVGSLLDEGF